MRPARPRLWSALEIETRSVVNRVMPLLWSYFGALLNPESTTMVTPGTVSEDSAIGVDTTTRLFAGVTFEGVKA